jgi:hypothetical protein
MNAPSFDVKDMLEAWGESSGFGFTFTEDLFIGKEPTKPRNCVTIFDTIGLPPELNLTNQGYEYPSIQIRVRNSSYTEGWRIISEIKNSLHGRSHQTWNGSLYTVIYCSSGPALLDFDDNGNARFIINFNLQRR